jgi:hypothetical protein
MKKPVPQIPLLDTVADIAQALGVIEKALKPLGGHISGDTSEISGYLSDAKVQIIFNPAKLRLYLAKKAERDMEKARKPPKKGS